MEGVAEASEASGCAVVGGDVSEAAELVVAVTVLGAVEDGGPPPVSRSGATAGRRPARHGALRRVGGGPSGAAGRRRRAPTTSGPTGGRWPGCARAQLARDGRRARHDRRLRRAGARPAPAGRRVGGGFELSDVPVAAGATFEEALGGGEDYELVIAASPHDSRRDRNSLRRGGPARALCASASWSVTPTSGRWGRARWIGWDGSTGSGEPRIRRRRHSQRRDRPGIPQFGSNKQMARGLDREFRLCSELRRPPYRGYAVETRRFGLGRWSHGGGGRGFAVLSSDSPWASSRSSPSSRSSRRRATRAGGS